MAPVLAAIVALILAPAVGAAAEPQASLPDIEDEVMCPICGTALNTSEAPQADRQRAYIRELIAAGRSKEEIKDELVAEYGPDVLAVPEAKGFDLAAWIVPGLAIVLAAVAIVVGIRRWRRDGAAGGQDPPAAAADADEQARLRDDLSRYRL